MKKEFPLKEIMPSLKISINLCLKKFFNRKKGRRNQGNKKMQLILADASFTDLA